MFSANIVAAPTNIRLVCRTAMMLWDDVEGATGYELLWGLLDGESDYTRIRNRTEVTLKNLSDSSEENARQYSAKLISVQNRIKGGSSPEFVFTTDMISKCEDAQRSMHVHV